MIAATARAMAGVTRLLSVIALFGVALGLAGCGPSESDDIKFGWFYRFAVELSHGDEPLNIEVIIGCGSQARHIPGEGRSVRALWAPYIYGVRTKKGEGVLVQSPNICDRELAKQPMPADFLPVVFWAPKADDLEFMVAYLNEQAYQQPVSKLAFHKATFSEASRDDYERWRATKWKDNIVPIGDRRKEYAQGASFFRGEGFFPDKDPRNGPLLRMQCHAFLRVPIPSEAIDEVQARWPADRPRYWLIAPNAIKPLSRFGEEAYLHRLRAGPSWDRENPGFQPNFSSALGVNRASGVGHIVGGIDRPNVNAAGRGLRIPYRTESGYPWSDDRLRTQATLDIHIDTDRGADHGFAYCYREMFMHYLAYSGPNGQPHPVQQRIFIDGELIGNWPDAIKRPPSATIIERDQYIWLPDNYPFPLTHELARMQ